jgi:uridine kinase
MREPAPDIRPAVDAITAWWRDCPRERSLLAGVSGIDGSGKGFVAERIVTELTNRGLRVANINVDGWLNLPSRRFGPARPASHFYEHGLRLDEMFERLVLPLRDRRSIRLLAQHADPTNAEDWRPFEYRFEHIDVVLVEGIFLFKRAYREHFDLRIWVDCTFTTALKRAIGRGQEGLPPAETIHDYETIYFPAQRLHFAIDDPRRAADIIVENDSQPVTDAGRA